MVFVDGGYVACSQLTDAGESSWLCQPGTYSCLSPGQCAQCVSDSDCADTSLPTYDARRPRCDLDSGVAGYQGFCQGCVADSDCVERPGATQCNLNPASVASSIELTGFETCADLGQGCPPGTQPEIGGCGTTLCTTDDDCATVLSGSGPEPAPYCVNGMCASSPAGAPCYRCYCFQSCSGTSDPDSGLFCNPSTFACSCTDSSQCGGLWPSCLALDGGATTDAGELIGACGCDNDAECGDGGLVCLNDPGDGFGLAGPACGLSCTDPRAPACATLGLATPICDPISRLCVSCESDHECQTQTQGEAGPFCRTDGICGCTLDSDCKGGDICIGPFARTLAGGMAGYCGPPPPRCTPLSCGGPALCDFDGGDCTGGQPYPPPCRTDYDCSFIGGFCNSDAGFCVECFSDSDCLADGRAAQGSSYCESGQCSFGCARDVDCGGNFAGPHCVASPFGKYCGCGKDQDCAGSSNGHRCETDAGQCFCGGPSECAVNETCTAKFSPGAAPQCSPNCTIDSDCPTSFFCDVSFQCRPRCDDGGAGCLPSDPICDTQNVVVESSGGKLWCYECLVGDDCPAGSDCAQYACGSGCQRDSDCHSGQVCAGNVCRASCDGGACPAGQTCDADGAVGNGTDVCYGCRSAVDCDPGQGCDSRTHVCGACEGPTANGGPFDCPPDDVCSNYWAAAAGARGPISGICLQNCDRQPCLNPGETCEVLPGFTPDHKYCFGCLTDSDCTGKGAWCDTSLGLTFTCKPGPKP